MWRLSRSTRIVLWAVAFAVLAVRASDTHVHLCLDGEQSPASMHIADASAHHDKHLDEHHDGEDHTDQDVNLLVAALVKTDGADLDFALSAAATAGGLLGVVLGDVPHARSSRILPVGPPLHFLPPLRGPPR